MTVVLVASVLLLGSLIYYHRHLFYLSTIMPCSCLRTFALEATFFFPTNSLIWDMSTLLNLFWGLTQVPHVHRSLLWFRLFKLPAPTVPASLLCAAVAVWHSPVGNTSRLRGARGDCKHRASFQVFKIRGCLMVQLATSKLTQISVQKWTYSDINSKAIYK